MPDSPLRQSLRAARANLGPGLVLQAFATALVTAYYLHAPSRAALEKLAAFQPKTLACMHGSAWAGDGAALLRELGRALEV